jgi:hypothetical protein
MYGRVPGFPGNACWTDYFREVQRGDVVAEVAGEDFNIFALRPHQGAIDCECSDVVDEASVSNVDE